MSVGNSVVSETLADVVVRAYTSPSPSVKTYFLYPYLYFLHFTTHRASASTPGFATTYFYLIAPLFLFSFFASDILSILGDFYLDRTIGGIWTINYACINQCSRLDLHNPMALQLLIE